MATCDRPRGRPARYGRRLFSLVILILAAALVSCSPTARSPAPQTAEAGSGIWSKMDLERLQVTAIAVDPTNSTIVFAGTAGQGIFRSTDSGRTWNQANNGLGNTFVNDLIISTADPAVVLAATGRGPLVGDPGAGIYRTTNRGDSWLGRVAGFAADLDMSPQNPQIIYAAGAGPPVLRSTNGGVDWVEAFADSTIFQNVDMLAVAVSPTDSNLVLVAGTTEGGSGSVFRTINAGQTWTRVQDTSIPAVTSLVFSPTNAQQAYFGNTQGVWRSRDAGLTWNLVFGGPPVLHLHADPADANVLYAGSSGQGVMQTANAGDSFVTFGTGLGNTVVRSLDLDRASPRTIWAGTDDGAWAFTFPTGATPPVTATPLPPTPTPTVPAQPLPLPSLAIAPASGPPGTAVSFTGTGFTPGGRASVLLGRTVGIVVGSPLADSLGNISGSFAVPNPDAVAGLSFGPEDISATDVSTNRVSAAVVFTIVRPSLSTVWYFAEGSTQPPFDTWYLVQNPTDARARVRFTFFLEDGTTPVSEYFVGPHTRFSLFANEIVPGHAVSARIESDQQVFAERSMFVGFDGHAVTGIPGPNNVWLFAEGSTQPPFDTWLLFQNPSAGQATATITYLVQNGLPQTQVVALPPTSRTSLFVNQVLPNAAFSVQVRSDLPIIVERSMFRFPGNAATDVSGVAQPAQTWFFAEGNTNTRGLPTDTWLLLQNPNPFAVQATVTAFFEGGGQSAFLQTLPPDSRTSLFLNRFLTGSFGIRVEASAGIIAERSMFFGFEPRGATATVGSPTLATVWHLPEGSTAPPFDETIAIMNPNAQATTVRIEFDLETGSTVATDFTMPALSKRTVEVDDIIASGAASALVTSSSPVVVERTMFISKGEELGAAGKVGIR